MDWRLDAWKAVLAQHGVGPANGDPGNYGGTQGSVSVTAYAEPNSYAYRNYCGPGSSQVVISNWIGTVPSIDTLASQAQTNPNQGPYLSNMVGPINNDAGTGGFYINQAAGSQGTFSNWIGSDIYVDQKPLITAIETMAGGNTLNGWGLLGRPVAHIIAMYGYNFVTRGAGTASYVETSGTVAGTTATGRNNYSYDPFWVLVQANNGQIW